MRRDIKASHFCMQSRIIVHANFREEIFSTFGCKILKRSECFSIQAQYGMGMYKSLFLLSRSKKLPSPCAFKSNANKFLIDSYSALSLSIVTMNALFIASMQACESSITIDPTSKKFPFVPKIDLPLNNFWTVVIKIFSPFENSVGNDDCSEPKPQ